ncbi:SIMPL domain-containing protein [Paracoccus saliphilus]|uniref:SIMPL domain-containing protein n=1 Tax=Paracoccus saliphilus TaxID=405559 RepID=A0AA45W2D1_9RHOB|nr:SIMPL domain-containing protein [Paracoccus saliphilus]WCR01959.1 SIMPL domain-containing protein [Paracoccus saliphilus]SIS65747.1 hypothetical protein SAMN05421772_102327 [Paracoccus saliphilus]
MTLYSPRLGNALMAVTAGLALTFATTALASPGSGHEGGMKQGHHGCGARGGMMMSRLTVTGQGEARIAPDLAEIRLGVTSQADSAAAAMEQNAEQQTAVIEALKDAGIAAGDIQTSGLNLQPRMEYPENGAPTINGYEATNMVSVRVAEVEKLGEVLDAIVAAGANQINGINFKREDAGATEDEARRAAVEDARHKAEILAEAAGLSLGPVIVMRDAPVADGPRPMMMRAEAARDASTPVEAGELSVSAQVQIDYALRGEKGGKACGPHGGKRGGHGGMQDDGGAEDQAAPADDAGEADPAMETDAAPDEQAETDAEAAGEADVEVEPAPEDAPASN